MEDHRLRAFCLVVEMKSFSRAAEAKFMTQSAMSHLIKNLEDEIGVRLFSRLGKTVVPTPAGKKFYEHAKKILDQYKKMENDLYAIMHKVKGPLCVGASTTAATFLLSQVFYSFSKSYPEVHIQLSVSNNEGVMSDLQKGRIDIGVVEGKKENSKFIYTEIAEDEIVIIASDDNPLIRKKKLNPRDLISQPFVMPEVGSGMTEFIEDFLYTSKIDPKDITISMTLGNPDLIIQMVQSGIGISFVSKWSVFKVIKEGTVKILHVPGKKLVRKFYLVSLDKEPSTMTARTFIEFLKGYRFFIPF
jgi:DNA-binding transcriptional LysR family regulator